MKQKLQYVPKLSWTTTKEFVNSFDKIEKQFVVGELKQLVPPRGIEPQLPVPQTSVLSIIR